MAERIQDHVPMHRFVFGQMIIQTIFIEDKKQGIHEIVKNFASINALFPAVPDYKLPDIFTEPIPAEERVNK